MAAPAARFYVSAASWLLSFARSRERRRIASLQQQPDQGPVADADADDGHGLVPQRVQIFLKLHGYAPNAALGGRD